MTTTTDYPRPNAHVHFGVFYAGVNEGVDWQSPTALNQIDFEAFRQTIQTAERGLFDAFFFGEGLRLREHLGEVIELNVAGRPDSQTHLAALAAITDRIGLVATQNATYHEPYALARRLATLDVLSGGRAAWNIVTTVNGWTGENFRRGGYVDVPRRYEHAEQNVRLVRALWDSWANIAPSDSTHAAEWSQAPELVEGDGDFSSVKARLSVPSSAQGHPVLFQAGDSAGGRDLAVKHADVIFSRHLQLDDALEFAADIRSRLRATGRPEDDVLLLPGGSIVIGDTLADAEDRWRAEQEAALTDAHVVQFVEHTYGEALPDFDPNGPLPSFAPSTSEISVERGTVGHYRTPQDVVAEWRDISEAKGFATARELVAHLTSSRSFVGTPDSLADELAHAVRSGAYDGLNLGLRHVPHGLDDVVNRLVPALQERGAYPTEYVGTTLRDHLGLRPPLGRRASA
ncbi:NtaA/DmoA family FMN-dependent monooxygenase [Gulosibacter sp. ACHW.36C]|uniref:NtaA/DmoA family FMN-dependent monooxygenase n=1 Tax=Gulosibacter sediminis TaxID=1729695 RepID=A0ABY4N0F2_9MICO|nr:NtaA/DmoA family FMN-dependent monooxygenase [Gulosibacter sediminis]UQN15739.1 NtaA/DmoA family FMN-dependent monooxygenase [Gulosibacter sediminis]